ncbi:MAG: hypothetical protein ACP5CD_05220 [Thermovirgaceae bacterium]
MKSKSFLHLVVLLFFVLIHVTGAWAGSNPADPPASEDDFTVLEQELEKSFQDGELSIPQRPGPEEEKEEPVELCKGMYHRISYSAKGTRSEARHGHLEIEGYALPDAFTRLFYREVGVGFRTRSHLWGEDGYWPDAGVSLPEEEGPPLPEEAKERGWILADKIPADIPEEWVWVKWKDGSAFVDAECLKDFINEMKLPLLERHVGRMEMPREELTLEDQSD